MKLHCWVATTINNLNCCSLCCIPRIYATTLEGKSQRVVISNIVAGLSCTDSGGIVLLILLAQVFLICLKRDYTTIGFNGVQSTLVGGTWGFFPFNHRILPLPLDDLHPPCLVILGNRLKGLLLICKQVPYIGASVLQATLQSYNSRYVVKLSILACPCNGAKMGVKLI